MNLKDYFQEQKQSHISDTDKLNLYQDFMLKNMKRHYNRKRSFLHIKSFVYSIVVMFFLFSLYGVYFFTDRYSEDYEGLIMNSNNAVQAGYIAQVKEFNGDFSIMNKITGKRIKTSYIQDGDIVTLKENTQLIAQINAGTKAKLIGPAQFSIEQISKGKTPQYRLNIIQGDFIEMKSMQKTTSEKIQLSIKNEITVQQANGNPIDYQLIKAGEQRIVKNSGGAISVTTTDQNNKQTKTNMNSLQVLAIGDNDIQLFDNMKKFADAMKTNNVSQIFTLNTSQEITSSIDAETGADIEDQEQPLQEVPLASLLNTDDGNVDQSISSQLGSLFGESKKVVTPEQNQAIRSAANKDFVLNDMGDIYKGILKGQEKELAIAYTNLERRIQQLHEAFGAKYTSLGSASISEKLMNLKANITNFIATSSATYMLPDKYFSDLKILNNRLTYLAGQKVSSNIESVDLSANTVDQNWSNLLQALPANLRF